MMYAAFTKKEHGIVDRLITTISVASEDKTIDTIAQWDTGASGTCISEEVANSLGLTSIGRRNILTPSGGDIVEVYLVDIILPNNVTIKDATVIGTRIGDQGIGALIGLDIISRGDFAITTNGGVTTFSFVIPSMSRIDFIPKAMTLNKANQSHRKSKQK